MKAIVCTRKGLFILNQGSSKWEVEKFHFEAVKTCVVERNPRTGDIWLGMKHGHWGPKLHVSSGNGETFTEVSTPEFPESGKEKLEDFWSFAFD